MKANPILSGAFAVALSLVAPGARAANIPVPSGFARYCSWINPSVPGAKWAFASGGTDPCGVAADANVRAAGYFDTAGWNQVTGRCGTSLGNMSYSVNSIDFGSQSITNVKAALEATSYPYCEIKIAPLSMPIFRAIHDTNPLPFNYGFHQFVFDELFGDEHVAIANYGQTAHSGPAPACGLLPLGHSCTMDYKGHDLRSGTAGSQNPGFTNQEKAFDTLTNVGGAALRAMADGQIIATRARDVSTICTRPGDSPQQGEIYVLHRMGEGRYQERFMVYYAHVASWSSEGGHVWQGGDLISKGERVGNVGNSGCTNGVDHLHYSVARLTNTTRSNNSAQPWRYSWDITPNKYGRQMNYPDNLWPVLVDPFGWKAPAGAEPGAVLYYSRVYPGHGPGGGTADAPGGGAMSSDLFGSAAPPRPCDNVTGYWVRNNGSVNELVANPYSTCL